MKLPENKIPPDRHFLTDNNVLVKELEFDSYTYKHSLNVAYYSLQFLKYTSCNIDESLVYYAGLFHDIGKTKINLQVLRKRESLMKYEMDIIKTHSVLGFEILSENKVPHEISLTALFHHERYDGTGYPYGLMGDQIPPIAQIISICDVFDALTSNRPYRNAFSGENALGIMRSISEQFNPGLLRDFFDNIHSITGDFDALKCNKSRNTDKKI